MVALLGTCIHVYYVVKHVSISMPPTPTPSMSQCDTLWFTWKNCHDMFYNTMVLLSVAGHCALVNQDADIQYLVTWPQVMQLSGYLLFHSCCNSKGSVLVCMSVVFILVCCAPRCALRSYTYVALKLHMKNKDFSKCKCDKMDQPHIYSSNVKEFTDCKTFT